MVEEALAGLGVTVVLIVVAWWVVSKRFSLSPEEKKLAGLGSRYSDPPQ